MIGKEDLVKFGRKEFATTLKVLKAFPTDQKEYRPHERSSTAMTLIATFIFEFYLIRMQLFKDSIDPSIFKTYNPDGVQGVIKDFEEESAKVISGLERMSESDFSSEITFAGRTFEAGEFAFLMICDQIHHRGQLSVYVRMAGGKVPAIYGPSADDKTPNL